MNKTLYRNTDAKMIAGVMAGLADRFGHDVVLWRLGAIVFLIVTGLMPGVLLYAAAWIIIPQKPGSDTPIRDAEYTVSE